VALLLEDILPEPIRLRDGGRVLDVGTGVGNSAFAIARLARDARLAVEVLAIDNEEHRRASFEREASRAGVGDRVRFVCADGAKVPEALGQFDWIVCVGCASQLIFERPSFERGRPARALWQSAPRLFVTLACRRMVRAWRRQLVPGGRVVVVDLDRDAPGDDHARTVQMHESEKWPLLSAELLREVLEDEGFRDARVRRTSTRLGVSREEAIRLLGLEGPPQREHAGALWPLVPSKADGDFSFSRYALMATRD
jgi:protein-L-isoaspartate O-methyltransferase